MTNHTPTDTPAERKELKFHGGWPLALTPVVLFLIACITLFVLLKAFEMSALATGGFIALLLTAPLAKDYKAFWAAVIRGIGSPQAVSIVVILLLIGPLSTLNKATGVSDGFVWLAETVGAPPSTFTLFTFITVCLVAMATGSSIGTMFTAFPIFYVAGVSLGANPALLAGAIVSGAVFGDNLAPISDTSVMSASTQKYRNRRGVADVGGVVAARVRYSVVAAAISAVLYFALGSVTGGSKLDLAAEGNPLGLTMLIPVAILLVVAFWTRDIFKAITVGLVVGTITALVTGLLTPSDVLGVTDGAPSGFLIEGVEYMLGTVALVIAVFGIVGTLMEARVIDRVITWFSRASWAGTPRGAEAAMGAGISATTVLFGGVNSASMLAFGPVADELGAKVGLHPYRRANVLDCFALGVASTVPFLSAYLFIGALLATQGGTPVSMGGLFLGTVYPIMLTLVMIVAVITGWGRTFEGSDGRALKTNPVLSDTPQ
ncbi:Na+/H+ antiporter NhaC family protein [Enemella sp. A6]|uniref:Na+/H+ antiporter NhaC family protein n=1 Tax=Enemella sp. A6 TaxID=3440152 RepID=UPI003EB69BB7